MLQNEQHRKLAVVCLVIFVLSVLLSLLEPGYSQICDYDERANPYNCAPHNVVYAAIWNIGHWINIASPALTAVATAFIGIFTLTLWRTSVRQGELAQQSITLARDEFLASHRPKIIVRVVNFDAFKTTKHEMAIRFTCVNVGDSPCEIANVHYLFSVTEKPHAPTKKKEMIALPIPKPIQLAAGEPVAFSTNVVSGEELENLGGSWDIYGMIEYRDTPGIMRLTGFWRRYTASDDVFTAPGNPDFNYEY